MVAFYCHIPQIRPYSKWFTMTKCCLAYGRVRHGFLLFGVFGREKRCLASFKNLFALSLLKLLEFFQPVCHLLKLAHFA